MFGPRPARRTRPPIGWATTMQLFATRRVAAALVPRPQHFRSFRQVTAQKTSKKKEGTGKDPYGLFKTAIASEPDAERLAAAPQTSREGQSERSQWPHSLRDPVGHREIGHLISFLLKCRLVAIPCRSEGHQVC